MQKGDFGNNRITAQGLAAIKKQVMFVLAADKLQQIRQMIRNGIPQIHIDNGKILAKVTFSVRETETEGTLPPATVGALPSTFSAKNRSVERKNTQKNSIARSTYDGEAGYRIRNNFGQQHEHLW